MSRNRIKIVSNQNPKTLSFFYMNEKGVWRSVSQQSELHWKYPDSSIIDSGEEIVAAIYRQYNTGKRGVDIRFEGSEEEYRYLRECITKHFHERDIECEHQQTIIAVAGKVGSGKTTFIEEICKYLGESFSSTSLEGYEKFTSDSSNIVWYEISGIDIGRENVLSAQKTLDRLTGEGVTDFIYCLATTKIEDLEESIISYVRTTYPKIKITLLLTMYVGDESDLYSERLSEQLNGIRVLPILAKNLKTRCGIVETHGLDDVCRYLFEGR